MTTRRLYVAVASAGFLSIALATALAAHALLEIAQSAGVLGGDYARHEHASVFPVCLAAAALALCGMLLYGAYLAGLDDASLPSLARSLRRLIGPGSILATSLCASLVLLAMESGEQLASGRFDGVASAFGSVPLAGAGAILAIGSLFNALAGAFCGWLASAHARLVFVVTLLLRAHYPTAAATTLAKRAALTTFDYVWDVSQIHGKRAPPVLAS